MAIFDACIKASNDPEASWTEYNRFLERAVFIRGVTPLPPVTDDGDTIRRLFEERYQGY